jgi:serine/threonine-protein kinase
VNAATKPRTLGNYKLLASLATGGMAKVYLALRAGPAGFNKLLVVKVLRDDTSGTEDGLRMFWDEARLSAQLVHPNVVHTYEVGENDGEYFLAMEYLEGQTYRAISKRATKEAHLPAAEHLRILAETARGLHYAHHAKDFTGQALSVVHRDVSPQNVFITYDGQVKVLDFGIAKTRDAEHKTQVGVIKGKLDYMAPEQVRGDEVDGRADVFALGAMLWEAVTGSRFSGPRELSQVTRLHARLAGTESKVRDLVPNVPEAIADIIDRSIAVNPAQRFADAAAFADAVDAYLASIGAQPSAKSLAAQVSRLFESERRSMHKLIEQQMSAVQRGAIADTTGELPRLQITDARSSSGQYIGDLDERSSSGRSPASPLSTSGALGTASGNQLGPRRPKASKLLVAAVAILAGGALALFANNGPEQAGASVHDPARAPAAAASAPTQDPAIVTSRASVPQPKADLAASVIVDFRASPAGATVTLDGAVVPLPFSGEFSRSATLRHIEASAPGYRRFAKLLAFDQNRNIEIELEPLPTAAAAAQPRRTRLVRNEREAVRELTPEHSAPAMVHVAAPAAASEPTPGSDLAVRPRVRHSQIDLADPYAN